MSDTANAKRIGILTFTEATRDVRVLKEARALLAAGHKVDVVGLTTSFNLRSLYEGVTITRINREEDSSFSVESLQIINRTFVSIFVIVVLLVLAIILVPIYLEVTREVLAVAASLIALGALYGIFRLRREIGTALRSTILFPIAVARVARFFFPRKVTERGPLDPPPRRLALIWLMLDKTDRRWLINLLAANRAFYRVLASRDIDIVHCSDFITLPAAMALKRRRPGTKIVYDSHELYSAVVAWRPSRYAFVRFYERFASAHVDACITVNGSIAEKLKEYNPTLPQPVIVCNATPLPEEPPTYDGRLHQAANLDPATRIVLFQGGFAVHRGLQDLTAAAAAFPPGWALVYMGWGNYEPMLREIVALVDPAAERIRFVPPAPQHELAEWTAGATIGLIPYEPVSLNHILCSPNKLWEYPRSGVPVLCSDLPEMAQRVNEHGIGWLIPADDLTPAGISDIIGRLSDGDIEAKRRACRTFIEKDNWSVYSRRLVEVYAGL